MLKHRKPNHTTYPQFLSQLSTMSWGNYSSCVLLQSRPHLPVSLSFMYCFSYSSATFCPSSCAISWHIFYFLWVFFKLQRPFSPKLTLMGILKSGKQVHLLISSNMADCMTYVVDSYIDTFGFSFWTIKHGFPGAKTNIKSIDEVLRTLPAVR